MKKFEVIEKAPLSMGVLGREREALL